MFRKLNRKTFGLAGSLVLAGGAISGTAASAQYTGPMGGCSIEMSSQCDSHWQNWGYTSHSECYHAESCYACPDSNSQCPSIDYLDDNVVTRHSTHGH